MANCGPQQGLAGAPYREYGSPEAATKASKAELRQLLEHLFPERGERLVELLLPAKGALEFSTSRGALFPAFDLVDLFQQGWVSAGKASQGSGGLPIFLTDSGDAWLWQ